MKGERWRMDRLPCDDSARALLALVAGLTKSLLTFHLALVPKYGTARLRHSIECTNLKSGPGVEMWVEVDREADLTVAFMMKFAPDSGGWWINGQVFFDDY